MAKFSPSEQQAAFFSWIETGSGSCVCAAIKAEDDYCVDNGGYMLDSDDCIKIVRGEWVRPDFSADAARKQGGAT